MVNLGELKHHVFIFKLYDNSKKAYRAFCAGSIITEMRVLSSAHCYITNIKRYKHNIKKLRVVGGILHTVAQETTSNEVQQWRSIVRVYTQYTLKYPARNLAVLEINEAWKINQFVDKIPYTLWNQDFDGVCIGTAVKPTQSWADNKKLYVQRFQFIQRKQCERKLLRSCRLYYCSAYNSKSGIYSLETEGGGLICHATGDPNEKDENEGILVGVMAFLNIGLPSLHNRVGMFHKWITDEANIISYNCIILIVGFICVVIKYI